MSDCLWQPTASIENLQYRAKFMMKIREFFNERNYLEVETPYMARFGITDIYLANIMATFRGQQYALQTSPEYHMKRLLAANSGPIFQLARVFRDDEWGRWHNPEFTLLEWYQLDIDHHQLIEEVEALLCLLLSCPPLIKKSYQDVFIEACDLDPFQSTCLQLKAKLSDYALSDVLDSNESDKDQYLFLLMSHVVEPYLSHLSAPVAVYDFPSTQASLAQINQGRAARFEIYYQGVELANGFHELTDKELQQKRFQIERKERANKGLPAPEMDSYLLQALEAGLPPCSGVAVGVDRLLALSLHQSSLSSVMSFDFSNA